MPPYVEKVLGDQDVRDIYAYLATIPQPPPLKDIPFCGLSEEAPMAKLKLSVAVGDYDRMRPLVDDAVQIDAVDPQFMLLEPEEIFFRAFRHADFDICELR